MVLVMEMELKVEMIQISDNDDGGVYDGVDVDDY